MKNYLMTYHKRDVGMAFLLSTLIIDAAVLFVTFVPLIYKANIDGFALNRVTGLSNDQIVTSFTTICQYLSIFHHGPLQVPYFTLSKHALIHFADVRKVMIVLQLYLPIGAVLAFFLIQKAIKEREVSYLKLTAFISALILIFFGFVGLSDFSSAFTMMHQLLFHNNYWLMDPLVDPVINIFPEEFFKLCLIAILIIIIVINALLVALYAYFKPRLIKDPLEK